VWDLDKGRIVRMTSLAIGQVGIPALGQAMPFRIRMVTALVGEGERLGPEPACDSP
jgi:hypothetical protein